MSCTSISMYFNCIFVSGGKEILTMEHEKDDNILPEQIRLMSYEIGELLIKLKEKSVFDFEENIPIILLDRRSSMINFKREELLGVKRFTSLVHSHLPVLSYLVRNPSFENISSVVERNDRIMGAIDYGRTHSYRQRYPNSNTVICQEIQRNYVVPENVLLAMTLFAILTFCDKYIQLYRLVETFSRINPTIKELQSIRSYVTVLLSKRFIRQILPYVLESRNRVDELLIEVLRRIEQNKTPPYFAKLVNLFHKWKYYISISLNENQIAENFLQYHFMSLADTNDLYECWVFCKILHAISERFALKLKEVRSVKGIITFRENNNSFELIYQARYATDWIDEDGRPIEDVPDISMEFKNGVNLVIDAKNRYYSLSDTKPNLHQMRNYMNTLKAKYGIFVHSASQVPDTWKAIPDKSNNQIIWTSLIPRSVPKTKMQNLDRILGLIFEISRDKSN